MRLRLIHTSSPVLHGLHIDRPYFQPASLRAFLAGGTLVAAATAIRLILDPWLAGFTYVTFFLAVIAATFLCGSLAGLVVMALSIASAWLFILQSGMGYLPVYQTALFTTGSVTVAGITALLRAASADVRRLNETLRHSEEKFRGLMESAPDAVIIIDEERRIALINAQSESLFGYARAELLGRPVECLFAEGGRDACLTRIAALLTGPDAAEAVQGFDLYGLCKDGRKFPAEIRLGLLKTESGSLVSCAIRDITERHRIEARLAEANKAKSDFLARMSHELRTPLNAIIGFSELIRDAAIAPLDARYKDYGNDINKAGRHLLAIINDILDISKIEGGHLELRDEIISIAECLDACERIVAVMAEAAEVKLSIGVPSGLPHIRCDQVRFRQVLLNVMSNAVKFTPAGGCVSVRASAGKDGMIIAVEDTGIGMKPEDIAIALEPFRQIDGALSRRFHGTGLGLPLAKALIELHGGSLQIQSSLTRGTTVRIQIPLERAVSAAA